MLAKYGEQIVPQFGLYNAQASYPIDVFAKWIRLNKQAHQAHGLRGMVPWVTTGFDGVLTESQVFEQAVHLFAAGATGFNVFSDAADGDWDTWGTLLGFVRATELVLPYEEIVAFGDVAFSDLLVPTASGTSVIGDSGDNVLAASAMKYQGQYLIALSPLERASPMHIEVNFSSSTGFVLHNLIACENKTLPPANSARFQVQLRPTDAVALLCLEAKE
jgi:4-alpha-glucanotransferase